MYRRHCVVNRRGCATSTLIGPTVGTSEADANAGNEVRFVVERRSSRRTAAAQLVRNDIELERPVSADDVAVVLRPRPSTDARFTSTKNRIDGGKSLNLSSTSSR
jgi:hypothetical protein